MKIIQSFPKLNEEMFAKTEDILKERFGYATIPAEYKEFLLKNNGGYVSPGFIDDNENFEHSQEVVFDTPLKWVKDNNKPVKPALVCFFGVWLPDDMNEEDVVNWELPELILSNANSQEDFDVLPDNMMSIATCGYPEASDILCLSLEPHDYGAVYYRYGMCDHPAKFHGDFYDNNLAHILNKYGLSLEDIYQLDAENPKDKMITNELKKSDLVKVGNSFSEFLNYCIIIDSQ